MVRLTWLAQPLGPVAADAVEGLNAAKLLPSTQAKGIILDANLSILLRFKVSSLMLISFKLAPAIIRLAYTDGFKRTPRGA